VQAGDEVKVAVLSIDQDKQRIALSMKQLEADPWTRIDENYHIGQLVEATITKLTKFGAFSRLHDEYELEGLIHISELSENHISHPREVIKPQDQLTVRIIRIDSDQRQLGLSLKQVASADYMDMDLVMAGVQSGEVDKEY
jgi:small subunit ribosomal protein S1